MSGGMPSSSVLRGGAGTGEGPSKAKTRLVRRLSSSSAMIAAAPVNAPSESYLSYIEQIPPEDGPQMFGMHVSVSKGQRRDPTRHQVVLLWVNAIFSTLTAPKNRDLFRSGLNPFFASYNSLISTTEQHQISTSAHILQTAAIYFQYVSRSA